MKGITRLYSVLVSLLSYTELTKMFSFSFGSISVTNKFQSVVFQSQIKNSVETLWQQGSLDFIIDLFIIEVKQLKKATMEDPYTCQSNRKTRLL